MKDLDTIVRDNQAAQAAHDSQRPQTREERLEYALRVASAALHDLMVQGINPRSARIYREIDRPIIDAALAPIERVAPPLEDAIHLPTLTRREAKVLLAVLASVGGSLLGPRQVLDRLVSKIVSKGVKWNHVSDSHAIMLPNTWEAFER